MRMVPFKGSLTCTYIVNEWLSFKHAILVVPFAVSTQMLHIATITLKVGQTRSADSDERMTDFRLSCGLPIACAPMITVREQTYER